MPEAFRMLVMCIIAIGCVVHTAVGDTVEFADKVSRLGPARLSGWVRVRGEFMIYPDSASMRSEAKYPRCLSGVFTDQAARDFSAYDGKQVTISGVLVRYSTLPDEQSPVLPRKILSGSVVPNFCLGDNVLLVKSISLISAAH
jgi:hypothetical protein